ncbi:MAG: EAL domain-containing protein [Lachnospiraceae bacterium]|nr:EAL domain-containing protein [Lachnospiraceae bacterium]
MKKKQNKYQLPKNHIVLPVIIYSIIFFFALVIIGTYSNIFVSYTTRLKTDNDLNDVLESAEKYELTATPEEEMEFVKNLDTYLRSVITDSASEDHGPVVFIADMNGIRYPEDGNLSVIFNPDPDLLQDPEYAFPTEEEFKELMGEEAYQKLMEGTDPAEFFPNGHLVEAIADKPTYYEDEENQYLMMDEDMIQPNLFRILRNPSLLIELQQNGQLESPYWVALRVKNNTQFFVMKCDLVINYSDIVAFLTYIIVSYTLIGTIFLILMINLIRTYLSKRKMQRLLFRDDITGDKNWFWFAVNSRKLIKKRRSNMQYAVVSLAFVGYRKFILSHSINYGEITLRALWLNIQSTLQKKEICAHAATSHFAILISAANEEEARNKVEKIIKDLTKMGGDHQFKFQAGICLIDPKIRKNADIDLLYNYASTARITLEQTDESGIAFFDQKLVEDEKWITQVTERQRRAIENEEFQVYYQPKYDPRTNEQRGAEALIRWVSKDLGFVSPGRFIPIFEKSGFVTEIDHYMITHVARDQKKWLDEGKKVVPVSVNVSRAHFAETNLAEQIRDMVDEEGTPHDLIEIELTESAFFDDQKQMLETIRKLKEYGFLVSMDDFGSGYSSLNSLKDMPLDILKLDAGFFRGKNSDPSRTRIVVSEALSLAKKLRMETVAEGVEEKEQVDFLAEEGCSMIQGYYFAKPMPREEYAEKIGKIADVAAVPEEPEALTSSENADQGTSSGSDTE